MSERVPEGWDKGTLGERCEILDSQRIPLNSQERAIRKGEYPYYGANGIQGYIDDFIFDGDAILVAEDGGNFDQYAHRPIAQWVTGKFWVNNHAHILRAKDNDADKWVFYSIVHKNILKFINGGTRAKLNQSDLREIEILSPPLPEQKKIASILTSVDEVIETTQKQIDKLQDLKKATMNELLTKGIGHTEFKDSELGRIPKSWEVKSVSEICTDIIDCVNKTAPVVEHPTPYKMIRTTNVRYGEIDTDNVRYVSEETFKIWTRRGVLQENDIIFTREAPVGETGLVDEPNGLFLGQRTMLYRADPSQTNPHFLLFAFQSEYCKKQLEDMTGGSTVGHMRVPDCSKIKFLHCSKDEQDQISSSISSINNNILSLKRRLAQTQSLKKSLMQDLLTGKVRVQVN